MSLAIIIGNILGGGRGGGGLSNTVFYAPLTHSLIPTKGELLSFDRAGDTEATITGFEGNIVNVPANAARFYGAREVHNFVAAIQELKDDVTSNNITTTYEYDNATGISSFCQVLFGDEAHIGDGLQDYANAGMEVGEKFIGQVEIRTKAGYQHSDVTISMRGLGGSALVTTTTSEWQIVSTPVEEITVSSNLIVDEMSLDLVADTNPATWVGIEIRNKQYERVVGSQTTASEYVSVGVGTDPEIINDTEFSTAVPDEGESDDFDLSAGTSVSGGQLLVGAGSALTGKFIPIAGALYEVTYFLESGFLVIFNFGSVNLSQNVGELNTQVIRTTTGSPSSILSAGGAVFNSFSVRRVSHGSNADGLKYFDTDRDGNPILATDLKGVLIEKDSTNLFLNSDAPVTQNIDTGAATGDFTVSVIGAGTCTSADVGATGTGHGVASEGASLTFNLTVAGTVSFTMAGVDSTTKVQVEAAALPTSYIPTDSSTANRGIEALQYVFPEKLRVIQPNYSLSVEFYLPVAGDSFGSNVFLFDMGDLNNETAIRLNTDGYLQVRTKSAGFLDTLDSSSLLVLVAGRHRFSLSYDRVLKKTSFSVDGGSVSSVTAINSQFFNSFTDPSIDVGTKRGAANHANFPIKDIKIESKTLTDAELIMESSL